MSREEIDEDSFSSDEEFDDEEETDSSTDIDTKLAQDDIFDEEFFNCYAALKNKDEKIYDKNVKFFSDLVPSSSGQEKKGSEPKVTLLSHQLNLKESDLDDETSKYEEPVQKSYYEKELEEIKKTIGQEIDSDSDDELLVVKGSETSAGSKLNKRQSDKDEPGSDHSSNIWADPHKLSEEDKYLRDYIINKRYIPTNSDFFSKNIDDLSDVEGDEVKPTVKKYHVEHHSDEKDFDKIKRVPRNSTKTIRDIVEKQKKKEKRLGRLEKKKKRKRVIKNADCEDIIGDLPIKFSYVETEPVDFGMTAEEILLAPDEELDSSKSKKKRKSSLKHDIEPTPLPSTMTKSGEQASSRKKKKHKRGVNHKKFAKVGVAPDRLLSYGLSKTKLRKSKLL